MRDAMVALGVRPNRPTLYDLYETIDRGEKTKTKINKKSADIMNGRLMSYGGRTNQRVRPGTEEKAQYQQTNWKPLTVQMVRCKVSCPPSFNH